MCGIAGVLSANPGQSTGLYQRMLDVQAHRGPDGQGEWARPFELGPPAVWLGHRRLAIIDRSPAAMQPMAHHERSLWITYNGEIYNYVELTTELTAKGHRFRSRSDTEVILHAYAEWGDRCLDRLNGMFAFAIWDERQRELFVARDRFGEKPFHYFWDERRNLFIFASEIKALLVLPGIDTALDEQALYRFVAFQELAGSRQTLWQGVQRLPGAHWLRVSWSGHRFGLTEKRYWGVDLERTLQIDLEAAGRALSDLLADSVRLRLRSDVPVGTSLSGGLDSSVIVWQIQALGAAAGQKTFSARMEDAALDEGRHIAAVVAATGVENHQVWPSARELARVFPRLCYYQEEPFISSSQFAQHLVMRLANDSGVVVLLDGQGADELLAGYTSYFLTRYGELAEGRQLWALWREWRGFRARHRRGFPLSARALGARLFPRLHAGWRRVANASTPRQSHAGELAAFWTREWRDAFRDQAPAEPPASTRDRLTTRLYLDAFGGELQELLRYGDRNSMAWSRELRQPFLDHRLAELVFSLPPDYKLRQGETKVVLRRAVRSLLPAGVSDRQDKVGYQAPLGAWLENPLAEWTEQWLEKSTALFSPRLDPHLLERVRGAQPMTEATARAVFCLLTLTETQAQLNGLRPREHFCAGGIS